MGVQLHEHRKTRAQLQKMYACDKQTHVHASTCTQYQKGKEYDKSTRIYANIWDKL